MIKQLPNFFFEIIGQTDVDGDIYRFSAPEVKQQSFRLDGLLIPPEGLVDRPLYFIELQTYKDEEFYDRFFGEIFVYFRQYRPPQTDWRAVVIYDRRSREVLPHSRYRVLTENHLVRVYLDELEEGDNDSLAIELARLFVASPRKALSQGRVLIEKVRSQEADDKFNRTVLSLIQGIIFYKFPLLTLAELETMLDLGEFTKTPLYQSILEQTRQEMQPEFEERKKQFQAEAVPKLLKTGLSLQQISECLDLDLEIVREFAKEQLE